MIWLGAYFQTWMLRHILPTFRPLCTFLGPFGDAQIPQNSIKKLFLVISDYFLYKNGPYDLVWGLFSSLDVRTYILLSLRPLFAFLSPFAVPKCPKIA
jgi:hypothetical protein